MLGFGFRMNGHARLVRPGKQSSIPANVLTLAGTLETALSLDGTEAALLTL